MSRYSRKVAQREVYSLFVVSVEGAVTEKDYIETFLKTVYKCEPKEVDVKILPTQEGKSAPDFVLDRLEDMIKEYNLDNEKDYLWLVMDNDRWTNANMSDLRRKCKQKQYNLALSIPCFELWLLLHLINKDDMHKYLFNSEKPANKKYLKKIIDNIRTKKYRTKKYHGMKIYFTNNNLQKAIDNSNILKEKSNKYYMTDMDLLMGALMDFMENNSYAKY